MEGLNAPGKAAVGNMLRARGPSLNSASLSCNIVTEPETEFYQAKLLFHVALVAVHLAKAGSQTCP